MKTCQIILLVITAISSVLACDKTPRARHPEYLKDIVKEVRQLDSAVNAIYGWEPRDSTFDPATDTVVAEMMNRYYEELIDIDSVSSDRQQSYDEARETWAEFKRLCENGLFKKALDLYMAEDSCAQKSNAGDIIIHLKHSSNRYGFCSRVLYPLLRAYNDSNSANIEYVEALRAEKAFEEMTILMNAEGSGYVPEVYPTLVVELGTKLAEMDKAKEAVEFTGSLINALYALTEDPLYSNYIGIFYAAHIYLMDDDHESAIRMWEGLRTFLDNSKNYTPEDLVNYYSAIDNRIEAIRDAQQYSMAVAD